MIGFRDNRSNVTVTLGVGAVGSPINSRYIGWADLFGSKFRNSMLLLFVLLFVF